MNAGDDSAFEALYLRYRDWVLTLAWRFTGSESLAQDVTQETFLYFLRKFPGFTLTAKLKTFFYPAVRHNALNVIAKSRRFQSDLDDLDIMEHIPAEASLNTDSDLVDLILSSLSENHREVLLLRYIDDLSITEMADILNIPAGTVKSRLHHALTLIRTSPKAMAYLSS